MFPRQLYDERLALKDDTETGFWLMSWPMTMQELAVWKTRTKSISIVTDSLQLLSEIATCWC